MRRAVFFFALLGLALGFWPAHACPFCNSTGTTLSRDAGTANMILFGTLKNPRLDPNQYAQGATDLDIELVIKPHEFLANRKVITLPRYLPQDPKQPGKYLVFCDIYKGQLDPYRGIPFKSDSKVGTYLKSALELKEKDIGTRLRFFFDFLDDPDSQISADAVTEFGNADYKDFRPIAEKFPADRVIKWLNDPATPASRYGLYGSMLGHCGKPADAAVLQAMIDDPAKRTIGGLDGVFAGLVMLTPKPGWGKLSDALTAAQTDFTVRFAGLKAVQFLWEYRPDVISRDEIGESITRMTEHVAIADLAIENLRKWQYWKSADKVMALANRPGFDEDLVKRALIRYALQCPAKDSPAAAAYVAEMRHKKPEWVKDAEAWLASETGISVPAGK